MSGVPIVIAHRGASGYLPEHTLQSKALAYGQGADYLEQDVIATRDDQLVVLHDLYLDDVSDVRERFPSRARDDGHFYVRDFDLSELRTLRLIERRSPGTRDRKQMGRFAPELLEFRIATFAEEIEFIQGLNAATGRTVGIYPEIKDPAWHRNENFDLARAVLAVLTRYGYVGAGAPCFLQCFDPAELMRVRKMLDCALRLVQLVDEGEDEQRHLSMSGLAAVSAYADAVGPPYTALLDPTGQRPSTAVQRIKQAGLAVHPWTLRQDQVPPEFSVDFDALLTILYRDVGVDGLFSDFPDLAVRARDAWLEAP